ncbi:hypothetical protein SAY87_005770 [Trapa incisa]|uniref:non-specific serine/threonine protein kinase n=1 Tax=Trapa incisa TaxID=236973 RepID=A0AAN7Q7L3_9MYRT|nr:hypothetical protein SAY87_005770 [Trapa incisa]
MSDGLSGTTSIFGLHLWAVVGICVGAAIVLLLFFISLCLASRRSKATKGSGSAKATIPAVSKEIQEIQIHQTQVQPNQLFPDPPDPLPEEEGPVGYNRIHIDIGKGHRIAYPERYYGGSSSHGSGEAPRSGGDQPGQPVVPEVSHLGWGHWYTLRELEDCTKGFSHENVIGEGGYGIVYYGVLVDNTQVAVKNLLNNRGQAEREFKVEVEAIGRVRHKNLVRLLGYCAEGAHRMLVYEYVNNGNLEQWLHGDVGPRSPLTWEIRMKIILGTAKGLTYLHEGLEPKVVHRDIKSSNILLDKQWNAKVSDFGLAKLLCSDSSYVTTRVMGTFGYVAPEYASTGMLNERSDVYSFGILIMEIISGRNPVDYSRPSEEVNLMDWLKKLVTEKNPEGVLDPKLPEKPASRSLKRVLLVALRCVDPTAQKRPKMGHVVHMLEAEESPFKDERRAAARDAGHLQLSSNISRVGLAEQSLKESDDDRSREKHENKAQVNETLSRHEEPMDEKL